MTVIINGDTGITSPADSLSGNLTFTGTGNRITGDFSNATVANRVMFQSSTVNGYTAVATIPNGTSTQSFIGASNSSDPNNASFMQIDCGSSTAFVRSTITGTGTYLPMVFQTGGSERMRVDTSGNVGIGTSSPSSFPGKLSVIGDGIVTDYDLISRVSSSLADADRGFKQITDGTGQFSIYSPNGGGVVFGVGSSYTERMRIDSSGNVGIGTSSPSTFSPNTTYANTVAVTKTDQALSFGSYYQAGVEAYSFIKSSQVGSPSAAVDLRFFGGTTERMRIDYNGNLLVNSTSTSYAVSGNSLRWLNGTALMCSKNTTADTNQIAFFNPNGNVGAINSNGSSTSYLTSSDYRLKENVQPMVGALEKVAALKPVTYKWKVDGSNGQGFIAHELQAVVPDCVTGEKDAADANGNPVYQGIDTSFLVATLTAAIQEQQAIIQQLRADVAQLKGTQA